MKENTLIEIGSSGTVILKFHTKTCINNKTYEAGEPYIFLRDVNVLIRYDNNLKTATDKRLVGAYSDIFPTSINISVQVFLADWRLFYQPFQKKKKVLIFLK